MAVGKYKTRRRAKSLRRGMTKAEWLLWLELRNRHLDGLRFRRQHPIGDYIADFACLSHRVVVELDGDEHGDLTALRYDARRDSYLRSQGWNVLRIANGEIYQDPEFVRATIHAFIKDPT